MMKFTNIKLHKLIRRVSLFAMFIIIFSHPAITAAQSSLDADNLNSILFNSVWYEGNNTTDFGGIACGGAGFGPGTLPVSVPEPLNGIATAAAQKFGIPAALVAAIYYVENNGKQGTDVSKYQYREPPPPYGNGASWPVSSAGAKGPFQFLDGTWASSGVDGNGDGKTDVLDLTDAAFGAASYLKYLLGQSKGDIETAAGGYEAGHPVDSEYGQDAYALYLHFSGGSIDGSGGGTTSSCADLTGCSNPLRDVPNLGPGRIDQGVDYTGDGPVYAACPGTVVDASTNSGWPGGNFIAYKVSGGSAKDLVIFVAENCTLSPSLSVGTTVTPNTVLCQMHNAYPFIEIGWGNGGGNAFAADQQPSCYDINNSTSTAFGVNFSAFMKSLGGMPGILQAPPVTCSLPSGWPTW